jgi:hypothetical protein
MDVLFELSSALPVPVSMGEQDGHMAVPLGATIPPPPGDLGTRGRGVTLGHPWVASAAHSGLSLA